MKKITLLGDSIRLGYQSTVVEALEGRAEVWGPAENCMHSVHHLFNLQPWYIDPAADVIHFNFGLWDCRRLSKKSDERAVPVELFTRNLDFILTQLRTATSARLIWATITPVVQSRYNARFCQPFDPCRMASDVDQYNAAALPVLHSHGVTVNDLHSFVESQGRERLICEDGVHYTAEGFQRLGEEVSTTIEHYL